MKSFDMHEAMVDNFAVIQPTDRNYNIDLLKIIACVAVVGLHTLQKDLSIFNATLYYCCGFAVPSFFMSSGYMLLGRDKITGSYVVKKTSSILRIVLNWSLLIFLIEMFIDILDGQFGLSSLLDLPIIAIKSLLQKGHLWQFWYLGALMIVYALLPMLFRVKQKLKSLWVICLVIGLMLQISSYVCGEPLQKHFIQTFRLWTWVQYFVLGGLLTGNEMNQGKITKSLHGFLLIILTGMVLVYDNFMGIYVLHNLYAEYFYDDILTVVWVFTLFTFVVRLKLRDRIVSVIERVAPITMGIYIIHPLFRLVGNTIFEINTILASLLYFAGILVLSAVICFIVKHFPGIRRLIEI